MKKNLKISKWFMLASVVLFLFSGCDGLFNPGKAQGSKEQEIPAGSENNSYSSISSVDFVRNMTIGWNLGNTLDAQSDGNENLGVGMETSWQAYKTTEKMLMAVKDAGFKTVRIPVSWHNHISNREDYTIDEKWMNRVKEVVDYAKNQDLYIILNIHHDNLSETNIKNNIGYGFSNDKALQDKSKLYLKNIWLQIAGTFASYDEKLIFEVLNEPRNVGGMNEWWTMDSVLINQVTEYEQVCIDAIRSVPGNEKRFIMAPGYAASGSTDVISVYKLPSDSAKDRLIFSVHAYSPYSFAMFDSSNPTHTDFTSADKKELDYLFNFLKKNFIDKNIGVVMGETGATNKGNPEARKKWFDYYFGTLYSKGIPAVLWDNSSFSASATDGERYGFFDRGNCSWPFPELLETMMKAVYGESWSSL